jgi:acetyltransferase-like isoleucine patch superfamily enzyme
MTYFRHPQALVETDRIGDGTRIWAFAHVLPGAVIGAECNICDHVFVENDVVVGDRVTVKCGVQLWDGLRIEDDVFIGPNATFTNDRFPRSKRYPKSFPSTVVERGASIGANATILPGIVIGRGAMVGAGAVVTRSVPPERIVAGNPARVVGEASDHDAGTVAAALAPVGIALTSSGAYELVTCASEKILPPGVLVVVLSGHVTLTTEAAAGPSRELRPGDAPYLVPSDERLRFSDVAAGGLAVLLHPGSTPTRA